MFFTTLLCYPSFALGILLKRIDLFEKINIRLHNKTVICFILLILLVVVFYWGITNGHVDMVQCKYGSSLFFFYIITNSISFIVMLFCSLLFRENIKIITTISNGTLLVLAVHYCFISAAERLCTFETPLSRFWLGCCILFICYWAIILCERFMPIMLGKIKIKL